MDETCLNDLPSVNWSDFILRHCLRTGKNAHLPTSRDQPVVPTPDGESSMGGKRALPEGNSRLYRLLLVTGDGSVVWSMSLPSACHQTGLEENAFLREGKLLHFCGLLENLIDLTFSDSY